MELNVDPDNFNETTFINSLVSQLGITDPWRIAIVDIEGINDLCISTN
jgi:hypothetical protein